MSACATVSIVGIHVACGLSRPLLRQHHEQATRRKLEVEPLTQALFART